MRLDHDTSYKQLFAHPELVCELLALCHRSRWARRLAADGCQRVSASYASESGRQRHGDMVWRILPPVGDAFYLVLEFQATPDRWMALRMRVYIGLLYQDLLKQGVLHPDVPQPRVLPVVLYHGGAAWPEGVGRSNGPAGLRRYQVEQPYLLFDVVRHLDAAPMGSVLTALFECTHVGKARRLRPALDCIAEWLGRQHSDTLRRTVTRWVTAHLQRRYKGITISSTTTLEEVRIMHGRQFDTFIDQLKYEEREEGRQEGRQEGRVLALRAMLLRALERQAGPLPAPAASRIDAAGPEQLQIWLDEMIDGGRPAELLATPV